MDKRVLLIEDSATLRANYAAILLGRGYSVDLALSGEEGLIAFEKHKYSVVILDLYLHDIDGIDLIRKLDAEVDQTKIIVVTSNSSVGRAIETMRAGAFDFLVKPFSDERFALAVTQAFTNLKSIYDRSKNRDVGLRFAASGSALRQLQDDIDQAAGSNAPVFIHGENGTGKDTCARAVHDGSRKNIGPFVMFNPTGLSADEQDQALFGQFQDGALTGGLIVNAIEGSLYIDDVHELAPSVQFKLAEFLRSTHGLFGAQGNKTFPRLIVAAHCAPSVLKSQGALNEDLLYQLNVMSIGLQPLRHMADEIPLVAETLLSQLSHKESKRLEHLSDEVSLMFTQHDWPGNVTQLQNLLYRIVVNFDGPIVQADMLPLGFVSELAQAREKILPEVPKVEAFDPTLGAINQLVGLTLSELESNFIEATIEAQGGSIPLAAQVLAVAPSTIYRKRSAG